MLRRVVGTYFSKYINHIKWRYIRDAKKLVLLSYKLKNCRSAIKRIMLRIQYYQIHNRYQCYIMEETYLPQTTTFPHGLHGIFISKQASIGDGCVIFHQVTIGSNTLKDATKAGAPKIGDNVYIGTGARIIGNINIGNNVRIGANAIVTNDIPDNATVVLPKPRVILHEENRENAFIQIEDAIL